MFTTHASSPICPFITTSLPFMKTSSDARHAPAAGCQVRQTAHVFGKSAASLRYESEPT